MNRAFTFFVRGKALKKSLLEIRPTSYASSLQSSVPSFSYSNKGQLEGSAFHHRRSTSQSHVSFETVEVLCEVFPSIILRYFRQREVV